MERTPERVAGNGSIHGVPVVPWDADTASETDAILEAVARAVAGIEEMNSRPRSGKAGEGPDAGAGADASADAGASAGASADAGAGAGAGPDSLAGTSPSAEPASLDAFRRLLRVFEEVARVSGATDELVTAVRGLLAEEGRTRPVTLPRASVEALTAAHLVESTPDGVARTETFARAVTAWQRILRAESEDFGPCGSTALDEWGADLIARVLGAPALSSGLRRELRRRGVAAFGLLADAGC